MNDVNEIVKALEQEGFVPSGQALCVLERVEGFPLTHFIGWLKQKRRVVGGSIVQEYICVNEGLLAGIRALVEARK